MQVRTDDEAETKIEETEKEKTRESAKRKQEHGNVYYKLDLQRPFFLLSFFSYHLFHACYRHLPDRLMMAGQPSAPDATCCHMSNFLS